SLLTPCGRPPPLPPFPPRRSSDLGFTRAEAEPAVVAFVYRNARRHPGALLHVITGRGKGSPGRPALKPRVRTLLRSGTLPVDARSEEHTSELQSREKLVCRLLLEK